MRINQLNDKQLASKDAGVKTAKNSIFVHFDEILFAGVLEDKNLIAEIFYAVLPCFLYTKFIAILLL